MTYSIYKPTPLQTKFHKADVDETLFGGAAGGGKTTAIMADAIYRCINNKNAVAYVFRRTYRELEDALLPTALALLPVGSGKYHASSHEIVFNNASVLRFRHCYKATDIYKYQGAEINFLYIDELTHFDKATYDYLKTRLRANVALKLSPVVRCTCNPGGIGHAWVKKRFVDAAPPFTEHTESVYSAALNKTKVHRLLYIPAKVTDNPHIAQDYVYELEKKPEALRKALLNGDWNTFEGQAFSEWRNEASGYASGTFSHVIHPFSVPQAWRIYRSFDFGYSKPFSVLWWAVDDDGTLYLIHEWYGASDADVGLRLSVAEIAQGILKREQELFCGISISGPADPSIWDSSRGHSVADQLEKNGVYFYPANNARLAGKMQFHYRLAFDKNGKAKLYVFSTCKAFIRTFPAINLSTLNPEDVDTTSEDHAYDAARYFLMSVPEGITKAQQQQPRAYHPLMQTKPKSTNKFLSI